MTKHFLDLGRVYKSAAVCKKFYAICPKEIVCYWTNLEIQLWTSTTTSLKIGTLRVSTLISWMWSNLKKIVKTSFKN
jgi:hypothetical protein